MNNKYMRLSKTELTAELMAAHERIAHLERAYSSEPRTSRTSAHRNEDKFCLLFKAMPLGVVFHDAHGMVTDANPAAEKILGLSLDQLCGRNSIDPRWRSLHEDGSEFPGESHPPMVALRTGQTVKNVVMGVYNPILDEHRWININAIPQFDADATEPIGVIATFEDFTERKHTETALSISETNYRRLVESSESAIAVLDRDGRLLYANPWTVRVWNNPNVIGMTIFDLFPQEIATRYSLAIQHAIDSGTSVYDYAETTINGQTMWFRLSMTPLQEFDGTVHKLLLHALDVTKQKLAENELRTTTRILQESQSIANYGSWTADLQSGTFVTTPQAASILGLKPGLLTLDELLEIIHPDDRGIMLDRWGTAMKDGNYQIEHRIIVNDEVRWAHVKAVFNVNEMGEPVTALGITQDITERKRAEEAQRASEEKYRGLVESLDSILSTVDYSGRLLYMNELAAKQLGGKPRDFVGKTIHELFPEPIASARLMAVRDVIEKDQGVSLESQGLINGQLRWFRTTIQPIHNEVGQVVYALINSMDIHDLKVAQKELLDWSQTLEERVTQRTAEVQELYDNSATGYHSVDADGRFMLINQTELRWLGYSKEEVLGRQATDFLEPSSKAVYWKNFEIFKERGWLKDLELDFVRKDGTLLPVSLNSVAVYNLDGSYCISRSTVLDNTERKQAEQKLRESEERYRKAISAADAVPYSLDFKSNSYTFIGEGIEKLLGYTQSEMTPRLFDILIEETSIQGELSPLSTQKAAQRVRAGASDAVHSVLQSDFLIRHKNGEQRWLSDISVQVVDGSGTPIGSIGILQNITERKKAEEALRHANSEMERAIRIKDEFLTSMSHELRTPLTGILGLSEALQYDTYGELNEKQRYALVNIESSGRHLLDLINDILDISKMEAGKLDLHMELCSVNDVCQAALQLVRGMAQKKNQSIAFSMNQTSIAVHGDTRRLKQIVVNLLSNAVKYSPEGSKIGLDIVADLQKESVAITVWDQGIGISTDNLKKLFRPFVQLDSSLSREQNGTGLGLALVQKLVDLHGGSVQVESTPGSGSRFTVTLATVPFHLTPVIDKNQSAKFKKALIVEDLTLDASRLSRYLRMLGIDSSTHPTGAGVVEHALEFQPDLILLDILLPDFSGWDVLAQLKAHSHTSGIPVIMTSVVEDHEKAVQMGAAGYLVKLFTQSDLHAAIVRLQQGNAPRTETNAHVAHSVEASAGTIMVVDDNATNTFMIEDYLQSKRFHVVTARNGHEFLSRVEAVRPNLVLMDIQMPELDGFETTRRLRSHPNQTLASVPVVAITALAMPGDRERCLEVGANEYLSKPIRLAHLFELIQALIPKKDLHHDWPN